MRPCDIVAYVLAGETKRRPCPRCNTKLGQSQISVRVNVATTFAVIQFACAACGYAHSGGLDVTPEIREDSLRRHQRHEERLRLAGAGAITGDELLDVHDALKKPPVDWWRELTT